MTPRLAVDDLRIIEEKVFVLQQIPYSLDDKGVGHVPEANVYFDETP